MKITPLVFIVYAACLLLTTRVQAQDSCQPETGQNPHAELFLGACAVYSEIIGQKDVWEGMPSRDLKAIAVNVHMSTVYAGRWGEHIRADLIRYVTLEPSGPYLTRALGLLAKTSYLTREELVKIGVRPIMDQSSYISFLEKSVTTFGGIPDEVLGNKRLVLETNLRWALEDSIITKEQRGILLERLKRR